MSGTPSTEAQRICQAREKTAAVGQDPERSLWAQVVLGAFSDMEAGCQDARMFLTREDGEWAKSRELVCAGAGIDANAVRSRGLELTEAGFKDIRSSVLALKKERNLRTNGRQRARLARLKEAKE